MRVRKVVTVTVIVIVATFGILFGSLPTATASAGPSPARFYLALGDSLPASFQPNGDMHSGYAEQLFQMEQARLPDLRLAKLACPGETTRTSTAGPKRAASRDAVSVLVA